VRNRRWAYHAEGETEHGGMGKKEPRTGCPAEDETERLLMRSYRGATLPRSPRAPISVARPAVEKFPGFSLVSGPRRRFAGAQRIPRERGLEERMGRERVALELGPTRSGALAAYGRRSSRGRARWGVDFQLSEKEGAARFGPEGGGSIGPGSLRRGSRSFAKLAKSAASRTGARSFRIVLRASRPKRPLRDHRRRGFA